VKILLVRLRLIGDVVFTTPVIGALRRRFPDAHMTYVVERSAAPVVAHNPHLSAVIVVPHVRGWRRLVDDAALGRRLRRARFDVAIDLHGGPRSAWLTWASGAPRRIGYEIRGRSWMYTDVVARSRELQPRHSVQNQWDLLARVDAAFASPASPDRDRVDMPVDSDASVAVARRLTGWGVRPDGRIIVVHVSAGNPFRRWPESQFAELTAGLAGAAPDRWVLITGGPSDRDAAARVIAAARAKSPEAAARIVDAEGLSLAELRAMVDHAALFVGGDSGPLHVASTSNVPIVALFGPTLPELSMPWRPGGLAAVSIDAGGLPCRPCDQRRCEPGDFRCLTSIPASRVRAAAETILEAAR
jgi:lipopolysaccharide heptosyltransferase II